MLTVNSVGFYKKVKQIKGKPPVFSGKYEELHFATYPARTQLPAIVINCRAVGEFDGLYFIRVRLGERVIYESAPASLRGRGARNGEDLVVVSDIESIAFHSTGVYVFDIIFNDVLLYSAPLALTWKTNQLKMYTADR